MQGSHLHLLDWFLHHWIFKSIFVFMLAGVLVNTQTLVSYSGNTVSVAHTKCNSLRRHFADGGSRDPGSFLLFRQRAVEVPGSFIWPSALHCHQQKTQRLTRWCGWIWTPTCLRHPSNIQWPQIQSCNPIEPQKGQEMLADGGDISLNTISLYYALFLIYCHDKK